MPLWYGEVRVKTERALLCEPAARSAGYDSAGVLTRTWAEFGLRRWGRVYVKRDEYRVMTERAPLCELGVSRILWRPVYRVVVQIDSGAPLTYSAFSSPDFIPRKAGQILPVFLQERTPVGIVCYGA